MTQTCYLQRRLSSHPPWLGSERSLLVQLLLLLLLLLLCAVKVGVLLTVAIYMLFAFIFILITATDSTPVNMLQIKSENS